MEAYDINHAHIGSLPSLGYTESYKVASVKNRLIFAANAVALGNMAKKPLIYFLDSYELDLGTIKVVAQNGGAFAFPVSFFLNSRGKSEMASRLGSARMFAKACVHYRAKVIVCSLAQDEFMAFSAQELVFFASLLGLDEKKAWQSLTIAKLYLE